MLKIQSSFADIKFRTSQAMIFPGVKQKMIINTWAQPFLLEENQFHHFHVSLDCGDRGSISEKYNPERMGWKPRKIMNYGLVKHAAEISISHHSSLYTSWKPYFKPDASPFFIQCDSDPAESWTRCVVYFEAAPRLHVMYHFTYGFLRHWQQIDEIARQAITVKNTQQSL